MILVPPSLTQIPLSSYQFIRSLSIPFSTFPPFNSESTISPQPMFAFTSRVVLSFYQVFGFIPVISFQIDCKWISVIQKQIT